MKKKATITVETERLLVISRSLQSVDRWCHKCRTNVKMIGIDEAATIAGVSQRRVFHLAEAGEIHFMETEAGRTMFCVDSLLRQRNPHARKSRLLSKIERNNQ